MRKFVLGVIFILFAHQSIPATAATICGRDVAGTNDSDVLIGYWQLPNGSQLCAGLVVNKTTKTTAEYVYGKGTRVHLIGEYDGSTYTLHDQQGSTFIFRPDGSASFVGGSGNLAGRFSRIDSDAANAETSRPGTLNSFEGFPIASIYRGPLKMPDFEGRDRQFRDFRTRIRNGISEGPNFAGRYKVIQFGCGTGCSVVLVADVSSGEVYKFPHGGEDDQQLQLEYRISSNLIRAWWVPNIENINRCFREDLVFRNGHFTSLAERAVTACPPG